MNIFLTVGTQEPFDRLVRVIDDWADQNGLDIKIYAQIGKAQYLPKNIKFSYHLTEQEFKTCFDNADLIVSHAGIGTIISCLSDGKSILTLPRESRFGEHRNDHQIATTKAFSSFGYIFPIYRESELVEKLRSLHLVKPLKKISFSAGNDLISFLSDL